MEEIINALLDIVREQQRSGIAPEAAMSRSDVVNMALKMMQQQGTEIEQETVTETWRTVLRMAPKLFGTDTSDVPPAALSPSQQIVRKMEPDKNITEGNENIALDKMIFNNFQSMLSNAGGGEIQTEEQPAKPAAPARPKSAAELAADAIREADEMKRKGIKPQAPKPGQRRPVTNKKAYKGIPKAPTTIRDKDAGDAKSASQLAYEAQKNAQKRAAEEARIRAELEEKVAQEAISRGEPDPRIKLEEEKKQRLADIRAMEIKRAKERGEEPPSMADSAANVETDFERKQRIEREQEERKKREWEEAEAEAKAAKERARAEREAEFMRKQEEEKKAKEEAANKARQMAGMSPEERKAAEERAAKRAKAKEEAEAAKEAKSAQTKLDAAKLIQERAAAKTEKAHQTAKKAVESIQEGMAAVLGGDAAEKLNITEEELNKLVMEKYQDILRSGTKASDINMASLTTMVIDALSKKAEETEEEPLIEDLDDLMEEAWGKDEKEAASAPEKKAEEKPVEKETPKEEKPAKKEPAKSASEAKQPKAASKPAAKAPEKKTSKPAPAVKAEKKQRKSVEVDEDKLFASFKNVKSIFGDFEAFLSSSADQRYLRTGIEPVDQLLAEGLEPGVYMVQAQESIGADSFCLQMADHMSSKGKDVIYLLSDSSRYGMMMKSISRLTYELRGQDSGMARSVASIMNCQSKADMANLRKEFTHYEEQIGEHLYLMEQKQMDADNMAAIIMKLSEAFERENDKKAVIMVDDIYWMLEDTPELLEDLADLAEDLATPIIISIGGGRLEDVDCITTSIRISYADTDGKEVAKEIIQKAERGEKLSADLTIARRDTGRILHGSLSVVPKFHYFGKE